MNIVRRRMIEWMRGLDAVAMPQTCPACQQWSDRLVSGVCAECARRLEAMAAVPYCHRCGRTAHPLSIDRVCPGCRSEGHWNIHGLARAGSYAPLLRRMVLQLKYAGDERSAPPLAARMAAAVRAAGWPEPIDALVPVPMHWLRRAQRRCNHAWVLAQALSRELGVPVVKACRRVRHTRSQVGLTTAHQRFDNIRRCFEPRRSRVATHFRGILKPRPAGPPTRPDPADSCVAGKTVCIVDNLMATGATVCEVSKALRLAGAARIYVAIAARAVLSGGAQADDSAVVESWQSIKRPPRPTPQCQPTPP